MKMKCVKCGTEYDVLGVAIPGMETSKEIKNETTKNTTKEENKTMKTKYNTPANNEMRANEQANIDPQKYVSMQDLQEVLSKYVGMPVSSIEKTAILPYAKSSQFFNKVMADGNIFNPYLHRRFLPAQYLKMMSFNGDCNGIGNFERYLREKYGYMYSIDFVRKEVNKLAFLQKKDYRTFNERKCFFTLWDVMEIMEDYIEKLKALITKRAMDSNKKTFYCPTYGKMAVGEWEYTKKGDRVYVESEEMINFKSDLDAFVRRVRDCGDYVKMNHVLSSFDFIKLDYATPKSRAFIECYKKSGAYYTIKHLIMFEGCSFKGYEFGARSLNAFMGTYKPFHTEAYQYNAMLKEMISDNDFDVFKFE